MVVMTPAGKILGATKAEELTKEAVLVEEYDSHINVIAHVQDILRLFEDADRRGERKWYSLDESYEVLAKYNPIQDLENMYPDGFPPYEDDALTRALRLYFTCTHYEELDWKKIFPREGTEEYRALKMLLDEDI